MKQVPEQLNRPFNAEEVESSLYEMWEKSGYFNPDNLPGNRKESYSVTLPPPNVTGTLHTGHAIMLAIQDTLVRYKRMSGYKTLWLPGTDHAAIATQSVVEKKIYKEEGKSRHDLGREEMLNRINEFAAESQKTILSQSKTMGASLDWSRLAFTLDEKRNLAVRTMFKKMYDDGLIYRGHRIVNWDPKGQTTISDDETVAEERKGKMYTFKYSKDFPIAISSTRPETKVGDVAVAVHPDDERYKKYVGKEYNIAFAGCPITIRVIADTAVEKDFGTGALGVTPAHSQIDWDIKERHNLPVKQVINEYAKMYGLANEELNGKKVTEAREYIVNWMHENNLIISEEDVVQNIPTAERTGGVIEPLPKLQWWIAVNKPFKHFGVETTLKNLMRKAVENKDTTIIPDHFEKTYYHWIENLHDWCISRQIWYGHRIPVYYKGDEIHCEINPPEEDGWVQDEDTLDTWFSSSMWTFSTLGWPEETKDMKTFHPTSFLDTGPDILFFWVARMILASMYVFNEAPFKYVYLHGMVRDAQGRKMSKSLNNALDPRELSTKYGTDALRMSLLVANGPGNDLKLGEDKVKAYKLFANKIWNATRFVLEKTADFEEDTVLNDEDQAVYDAWRDKQKDITSDLDNHRLHIASEKVYDYFWKVFCDEIIETRKTRILENRDKESAQALLLILLREQMIVIHPFMPFITEEVWKYIKKDEDNMLIVTHW
ncbi:valine--tRNA ligase [Candidatus Gracilibacteria bacterium]|nr:valine--tRNA ligase [Candidatus Gracilibacteria bacterium]MCF7898973.1 valine--tRNA ligase [Candidatus Paceibacterota bacterium]